VQFGAGAAHLILAPSAAFAGAVQANASYANLLELATGSGTCTIFGLGDTVSGFGTIAFDAAATWHIAGDAASLAAGQGILGLAVGDTIELTGFVETGDTFTGAGLVLSGSGGPETIGIQGSFVTGNFNVSNDGANSFVALNAPCFAAGTRIGTEHGAVPVEALRQGDRVPVVMGGTPQPIVWLGHRHVDCSRHPDPTQVWPIRLSAGAFGPSRPFRDLYLSPDHAPFVAGVLIPVRYLVNGTTIRQEARDAVTYWHVELPRHNVLYAEGVPAESYLDTGNRAAFANCDGIVDLRPDFARRVWDVAGCAPLVVYGSRLAVARRRLLTRAAALGHRTTNDPAIRIYSDDREVPVERYGRTWRALLPASSHVRLVSRVWQPAHMRPTSNDARALGVAIARLSLDRRHVGIDEPCFARGWYSPEQTWRWTNGDGWLTTNGAQALAFDVALTGTYRQESQPVKARAA
jgi:hypothetical protein